MSTTRRDPPIGARTFLAEARLREEARKALLQGFPEGSESFIRNQLNWSLGEDPGDPHPPSRDP